MSPNLVTLSRAANILSASAQVHGSSRRTRGSIMAADIALRTPVPLLVGRRADLDRDRCGRAGPAGCGSGRRGSGDRGSVRAGSCANWRLNSVAGRCSAGTAGCGGNRFLRSRARSARRFGTAARPAGGVEPGDRRAPVARARTRRVLAAGARRADRGRGAAAPGVPGRAWAAGRGREVSRTCTGPTRTPASFWAVTSHR